MTYRKQTWRDYDDTKTEIQNLNNGAVVTPERMNHIETGIANSANKEEVAAQLAQTDYEARRKKGLEDLTPQVLSAIGGGQGTEFNLLSKPYHKSVTPFETTFVNQSSNLFNKDDVVKGKVILANGDIEDNTGYVYSRKISVLPERTLYIRQITNLAWYDQGDAFISRTDGGSEKFVTVPTNAYFVRANITYNWHTQTPQISMSDSAVPYEPFYQELQEVNVNAKDIKGQLDSSQLKNKSVTHQKIDFIKTSTNLLDREKMIKGAFISASGEIVERGDYYYTHRIEVSPGDSLFTRHLVNVSWYDVNDNFIVRWDIGTPASAIRVAPENAYFVRGNVTKAYYDSPDVYPLQVSISDKEISYEPYYVTIENLDRQNPSLLSFKNDDRYIINGTVDNVYRSEQLEGYENVEADWLPEKIYQKFDELLSDYPSYVSKTTMGKDSSGLFDINMYHFKPEQVPNQTETKRPKMILLAGNHGYEKTHPYVLYLVMKKISEEWKTDVSLETLRWNVEFIVIPCSNPSSFEGGLRTNANGVDISRNFEAGWENSNSQEKGSAPLSEPESQYIDNVLKEHHEDAIFFTSLHNFTASTVDSNYFIWTPAADKLQEHISQEHLSRMSRMWKNKYEWVPQDDNLFFGYVDRSTPPGLEGLQANLYGISASTYEISRIFRLEENPTYSNSQVITMGVEALINLLLLNLKVGVEYYNNNKKVLKK